MTAHKPATQIVHDATPGRPPRVGIVLGSGLADIAGCLYQMFEDPKEYRRNVDCWYNQVGKLKHMFTAMCKSGVRNVQNGPDTIGPKYKKTNLYIMDDLHSGVVDKKTCGLLQT